MIIETVGSIKVIDDAFKLQKMIVQVGENCDKHYINGWLGHFDGYLNRSFYVNRNIFAKFGVHYCVFDQKIKFKI